MKNGILIMVVAFGFLGSSSAMAATDSASTVDEVVSWWEKYGKYWDDAVADSGSDDANKVASND